MYRFILAYKLRPKLDGGLPRVTILADYVSYTLTVLLCTPVRFFTYDARLAEQFPNLVPR